MAKGVPSGKRMNLIMTYLDSATTLDRIAPILPEIGIDVKLDMVSRELR